jgi:hypothetical protein
MPLLGRGRVPHGENAFNTLTKRGPILDPLSQERRITFAKRDSIYPMAEFGPDGNVGILFRDDRDGEQHVWFTRLGCIVP